MSVKLNLKNNFLNFVDKNNLNYKKGNTFNVYTRYKNKMY